MRAALFHQHGGPEVVTVAELPIPEPGPGEVRLAVRTAALNHLDLFVRRGLPNLSLPLPHVGGSDLAGVVDAVGPGVTGWAPGDEVVVNPSLPCLACPACRGGATSLCERYRILGEHLWGGLADYAIVRADRLHPKPTGLGWPAAAAFPLVFQTAWRALVTRAAVRPGETVLVLGAGGGVATAAIQIARLAGARVIAVTSSPERAEAVRRLGAHEVINRSDGPWAKTAWALTGKRGADIVVDSVGPATWSDSLRSARRGGRVVTYGATTGSHADTDLRQVFYRQLTVIGSTMADDGEFATMLALVARGDLVPVVDRVLPLAAAAEAHAALERGEIVGKVIVELSR